MTNKNKSRNKSEIDNKDRSAKTRDQQIIDYVRQSTEVTLDAIQFY